MKIKESKELRIKFLTSHKKCNRCGKPSKLLHHKDHNHKNHTPSNFEALCHKCHLTHHAQFRGQENCRGRHLMSFECPSKTRISFSKACAKLGIKMYYPLRKAMEETIIKAEVDRGEDKKSRGINPRT